MFSSCIVKSLKPFYTQEAIEFQENLLGKWEASNGSKWLVFSIIDIYTEQKKDSLFNSLTQEDLKIYKELKDAYLIGYLEKEQENIEDAETYMAVPFKIKDEVFIDFIPYDFVDLGTSDLLENHLLKTHSVAKLESLDNKKIKLTWLDSSRLNDLYKESKVKLKREIVSPTESDSDNSDYVLSASSEELYQFLEKYVKSDIKNKWESDTKFTLSKVSNYETLKESYK